MGPNVVLIEPLLAGEDLRVDEAQPPVALLVPGDETAADPQPAVTDPRQAWVGLRGGLQACGSPGPRP